MPDAFTRISRSGFHVLAWVTLLCSVTGFADNWPQFRGPRGQGISTETGLPAQWNAAANIVWKTALPGPGHSSPVIWGDRIFLTAFRKQGKGQLLTLCVDKASGRILWEKEVPVERVEAVHATNSPASPTPATDGKHVYVYFGSYGLVCFDFEGKKIWEKPVGPYPIEWGSASSPIVYGNLVLLNCDTDAEDFLLAVDKNTGRTVWQAPRSNIERAWPTPVIWSVGGKDQIVVSGSGGVKAYDPRDGRELWTVEGVPRWVGPTPVAAHGLLYVAANGRDPENFVMAIRPGGRGNVTKSHVAWRYDRAVSSVPSPVVVGDYLYMVRNGGIMTCLNAKTGALVWQERLPGKGDYYASPVAADGKIYLLSEEGIVTVIAARPVYQLLGTNDMGERCMASPAISDGRIFIRSDESLFCIGKPRP
ncbi:MAG TPA: PQQ-binding-like beta-propeller repeat protein [Blastocatellia bacterium]|nr:PQQ-binding-like beta-propeller repeat protein [Blastocatellia bacterium]